MNTAITEGIITALKNDTTLETRLGGKKVSVAWPQKSSDLPCVTVVENTEGSAKRPGYTHYGRRDQDPVIQVDTWSGVSYQNAEILMNQVEEVLIKDITNTRRWEKIEETPSYEPELPSYRVMARFRFRYSLQDTV